MARDTRKYGVVAGVCVAVAARRPFPCMRSAVNRKLRMAEYGPAPTAGGMALSAISRKSGRRVTRICCAGVFLGMTGITVGRRSGVYARDMAVRTLNGCMRPGQRKPGAAVIK